MDEDHKQEAAPGRFVGEIRQSGIGTAAVQGVTAHGDAIEALAYVPVYEQWDGAEWAPVIPVGQDGDRSHAPSYGSDG